MPDIENVTLELLRAGPSHNQLVSPLTPYIALCGSEGPVTVHLPFEHHQLLNRLERLRYVTEEGAISARQREAELLEIGATIGDFLTSIPTLNAQIAQMRSNDDTVIHLRVVVSGAELAMVPFEFATSPAGFPGSGLPLLLQSDTPIVLTRGVRRGQPLEWQWDGRKPKILFISASPAGVAPVPLQQHVNALRAAIDPWIHLGSDAERVQEVKQHLTVLADASLEKIKDACEHEEYTHVHILAHGIEYKNAGEKRYGVALCNDGKSSAMEIVPGLALAQALRPPNGHGSSRRPTVVTLATCDSGNVGEVLTPGGSVAHDLHSFGIPWVIASQFPLTMAGSVIMTQTLYSRLLHGDDPRWILYRMRQELASRGRSSHDWASLIIYGSWSDDLEQQVRRFRDQQMRAAIDVKFANAHRLTVEGHASEEVAAVFDAIDEDLDEWRKHLALSPRQERIPRRRFEQKQREAEFYGLVGACRKRIAVLKHSQIRADMQHLEKQRLEKEVQVALRDARDNYFKAVSNDMNHWVVTQYLSLNAVLDLDRDNHKKDRDWWCLAHRAAQRYLGDDHGAEDRAWAHATLAELQLLKKVYGYEQPFDVAGARGALLEHCRAIVELMGADSLHARATMAQFGRYKDWWGELEKTERHWTELAENAIDALSNGS